MNVPAPEERKIEFAFPLPFCYLWALNRLELPAHIGEGNLCSVDRFKCYSLLGTPSQIPGNNVLLAIWAPLS